MWEGTITLLIVFLFVWCFAGCFIMLLISLVCLKHRSYKPYYMENDLLFVSDQNLSHEGEGKLAVREVGSDSPDSSAGEKRRTFSHDSLVDVEEEEEINSIRLKSSKDARSRNFQGGRYVRTPNYIEKQTREYFEKTHKGLVKVYGGLSRKEQTNLTICELKMMLILFTIKLIMIALIILHLFFLTTVNEQYWWIFCMVFIPFLVLVQSTLTIIQKRYLFLFILVVWTCLVGWIIAIFASMFHMLSVVEGFIVSFFLDVILYLVYKYRCYILPFYYKQNTKSYLYHLLHWNFFLSYIIVSIAAVCATSLFFTFVIPLHDWWEMFISLFVVFSWNYFFYFHIYHVRHDTQLREWLKAHTTKKGEKFSLHKIKSGDFDDENDSPLEEMAEKKSTQVDLDSDENLDDIDEMELINEMVSGIKSSDDENEEDLGESIVKENEASMEAENANPNEKQFRTIRTLHKNFNFFVRILLYTVRILVYSLRKVMNRVCCLFYCPADCCDGNCRGCCIPIQTVHPSFEDTNCCDCCFCCECCALRRNSKDFKMTINPLNFLCNLCYLSFNFYDGLVNFFEPILFLINRFNK